MLHTQHFLSIHDLTGDEFWRLLDLARDVKRRPAAYARVLPGRALAMIFEKPSLRTRVTFELGIQQLGGLAVYLGPDDIALGRREAAADVARNLSRWVQGIMVRTFAHATCLALAEHAGVPVINGLTDLLHPCQAMADYMTLRERLGDLRGLRLAYLGDGNNVAHSLMFGAAKGGVRLVVATPRGYEPDATIVARAREDARKSGAEIVLTDDPRAAAEGADAVYTDVWASMGHEAESAARREAFAPYQVNRRLMAHARPGALFLHCLPCHRGEEVTDEVIDSPYSAVYDQAENRLHIQKAIMVELMGTLIAAAAA
jgi:ornithine carbamoyltransferase